MLAPSLLLSAGQSRVERRHRRQPLGGACMASAAELLEFNLQGASNRAGLSVANGAEVDLAQANDFGGGATNENLIRDVELVAGNRLLDHVVTQITRQCQQAVARDALENALPGLGCKSRCCAPEKCFRPYTRRHSLADRA